MAKETEKAANNNLGNFVDEVTPIPKFIQENYISLDTLSTYLTGADVVKTNWINQMVDIVISCNKQEKFLSLGELIAFNTLRKLQILF